MEVAGATAPPAQANWADHVVVETHEVRIRSLEATLAALRAQYEQDTARHESRVSELRSQIADLRAEATQREAQHDTAVAALGREVAVRQQALAAQTDKTSRLQQRLEARDVESRRCQEQLRLASMQMSQSQSEVQAAYQEKARCSVPLVERADKLTHELAVKERQLEIMRRELEGAGSALAAAQHETALRHERAAQVQAALAHDVRCNEEVVTQLQEAMQQQANAAAARERVMQQRCDLLQAWCFRTWWRLDSTNEQLAVVQPPVQSAAKLEYLTPPTLQARRAHNTAPTNEFEGKLRDTPLPASWVETLRFQATLFHWLAAETVRGKKAALEEQSRQIEIAKHDLTREMQNQQKERDALLEVIAGIEQASRHR